MAQLTWHPATAWPLAHQAPPWSWSSAGLHPHADTPDRCMDRIFVTFINPTPRLRYATGRRPPAVIDFENVPEGVLNPQFNAFGECVKNSCSYVSITQRYKGYAKYAPAIEFARTSYVDLKKALVAKDTTTVDALLEVAGLAKGATPSPICNGLRQMTLLANALFISEANPRSQTEALLARYYVNECFLAMRAMGEAMAREDTEAALVDYKRGADGLNSNFTCINRAIPPKVGEPFAYV